MARMHTDGAPADKPAHKGRRAYAQCMRRQRLPGSTRCTQPRCSGLLQQRLVLDLQLDLLVLDGVVHDGLFEAVLAVEARARIQQDLAGIRVAAERRPVQRGVAEFLQRAEQSCPLVAAGSASTRALRIVGPFLPEAIAARCSNESPY